MEKYKTFIVKFGLLRGILIVSVIAVLILPFYSAMFVYPSFIRLLTKDTEDDAVRIATHLNTSLLSESGEFKIGALPEEFPRNAATALKDFKLMKMKVFSAAGEIIYSTDPKEIGTINKEKYFHEVVAKGGIYTKVVKKDTLSLEGQKVTADVVETYVPIMRSNKFIGAFEIYLDITARKGNLHKLILWSYTVLFSIALALLIAVIITSRKAGKTITERNRAEEQIIKQSTELKVANDELLAFYEVSSAISRTIDMDELLAAVLNTVTGLGVLNVERKGGIFIIDGNKMRLASHLGHSKEFIDLHKNMKIGDCLCGKVAETGEILISKNSANDSRHTIIYPDALPHGHIIVPLKAINKLVGVLYLYLSTDFEIDENKKKMLLSIGSQIGMAIDNARLYEETKLLTLRDPLTGLANRRLMEMIIDEGFARAQRYARPLSIIMLDIDDFKKYNDTYGHPAGDKLLSDIAQIISKDARESDLVARYGGEEFLLMLSEAGASEAHGAAERIRKEVEEKRIVTISLGVATYKQGMQRKQDLINRADEALYLAKQKGKNRVEVI